MALPQNSSKATSILTHGVENKGNTTAHDLELTDNLPSGLRNVQTLQVSGDIQPDLNNHGNAWSTQPFDLPAGNSLTITFAAVIADTVLPGDKIQNTISATFSSLPGPSDHQRDGSDGSHQNDSEVLNNYNTSAGSQTLTIGDPVTLDKRFHPDPSRNTYTIGETLTYRLRVDLIQGTVNSLVLVDELPTGLSFISASLGLGNAGITTEYSGTPQQSGSTLTFDLGTVTNPANDNTEDDFLTVDIQARVENILANQDGVVLGNNAHLTFQGPEGDEWRDFDADADEPGIQPLNLTVVEPDLQISKAASTTIISPNKDITFTLTIEHTGDSTADAYDLWIGDTLPDGLNYIPDSASPAPAIVEDQTLIWNIAALTRNTGSTIVTYRVESNDSAVHGDRLRNTAELMYASRPGATGDADSGRNGIDGQDGLNDYVSAAEISTDFVDGRLDIEKTAYLGHDNGAGCPGEKELVVVNKDPIPVDMTWCFVATNTGESWLDEPVFTDEGLNVTPQDQSGMQLRNGDFPLAPGASAVWFYEETRLRSLVNYVELEMIPVEPDGSEIPGAEPVVASDSIPAIFGYVFDPPFGVKKGTVDDQSIVRWTMVWVNDNVIRADGVLITDPPPEGMTMFGAPECTAYGSTTVDQCAFDPPSAEFPRGRVRVLANFGPDFGVTLGTINEAENRLEIAFDVLVDNPEVEATYENKGHAEWTPPGEDEPFEAETYDEEQLKDLDPDLPPSDVPDQDDPRPTPVPIDPDPSAPRADLVLTKTVDNPRPQVDQQVQFTIRVTNNGPDNATGVRVSEQLPAGYAFLSASAAQGNYSQATGIWNIGPLNNGQSTEMVITVRVLENGPYTNYASVRGDQVDPRGDNNGDDATITIVAVTPPPQSIPTMSEWGLIIMSMLMALSALYMRRRGYF
ncbi:IPTL-CTERM sorting domain-containing protein [Desulfonatronovibrio magnus]|uniref:IPTL-CTERM sorting domain-containing protein n=1 Tax=Desulfonatronovibrio magnus TaxID=698827 RepID=UPI0005EB253D|nr:IPTL-CTERM sorting domain-containing protein [Desulfonatronovibrio magnus]